MILYIIPCISTHVLHPLKKSRICNVIIHYVLEPAKTNKICICIEKYKYMFACNVNNIYIYCHNKAWLCFPAIAIKLHINTLPETNMASWKLITLDAYQRPWKWMVGRILPFWGQFWPIFSGLCCKLIPWDPRHHTFHHPEINFPPNFTSGLWNMFQARESQPKPSVVTPRGGVDPINKLSSKQPFWRSISSSNSWFSIAMFIFSGLFSGQNFPPKTFSVGFF